MVSINFTNNNENIKGNKTCVILLSAGLDSFVSLGMARDQGYDVVLAITADYGQAAAGPEIRQAREICEFYGIRHLVVDLRDIMSGIQSGLLSGDIPDLEASKLDDVDASLASKAKVWVPNRNGLLINLAAMYSENMAAGWVISGFNREEARTFPDNSIEFIEATNQALAYSTSNQVRAVSFTQNLDKEEIVAEAVRIKLPLELAWSCYHDRKIMCGKCESCQRLKRAIRGHETLEEKIKFSDKNN